MRKVLTIVVIVAVLVGVLVAAVATFPEEEPEPPPAEKEVAVVAKKGEEPKVESREEKIVFEVEKGEALAPFEFSDDPSASGGKCAKIPEISPVPEGQDELNPAFKTVAGKPIGQKKIGQLPPGTELIPNGKIEVPFEIKAEGEYVFWARCWFPNSCADSFYFSIDSDDPVDKNGNGSYDPGDLNRPEEMSHPTWKVWRWVEFRPKTFHLKPGEHTLKVFNREDGIKVDQFLLALVPPSGDREDAHYPVDPEEPTQ